MEPYDIEEERQQLQAHRGTLAISLRQLAQLGEAFAPPGVFHNIRTAREGIARCKATLRGWGVLVTDNPDDEDIPADLPPVNAAPPVPAKPSLANPLGNIIFSGLNIGGFQGINNGTLQITVPPPPPSPLPRQLPIPRGPFIGRDKDMNTIAAQSEGTTASAPPIAIGIHGPSGVGKTAFAIHLANQIQARYPDGQIFLRLHGSREIPLSPEQALNELISAFKSDNLLPTDLFQLQNIYRSMLYGKQVLILVDDLPSLAHLRSLLPPPGCALIFTSRRRFVMEEQITWVKLDPLAKRDAISLLRAICPRLIRSEAATIAGLCENLPLALCLSASLLEADPDWSIREYIDELADERTRLERLHNPDDPNQAVTASLNLSYQALSPPAQDALGQLGVFVDGFDREALESVVVLSGADHKQALSLLRRCSLLAYDGRGSYNLHDLVRLFALQKLRSADVYYRYAHHYAVRSQRAHTRLDQGSPERTIALKQFHQDWPHIQAGWTWACSQSDQAETTDLLLTYAAATLPVFDRLCAREKRLALLKPIPTLAERVGDRVLQAAALIACGDGSLHSTDTASPTASPNPASAYYHQALAVAADRHSQARAYIGLGIVDAQTGDHKAAISSYFRSRSLARDSGDHHTYCLVQSNLGNIFVEEGRIEDAVAGYWKALELARQFDDRRIEVKLWRDMGAAATALVVAANPGHHDQCRAYLQWAVECYERSRVLAKQIGDQVGEYDTRCHQASLDRLIAQWQGPNAAGDARAA